MEQIDMIMKNNKKSYNKSLLFLFFVVFSTVWLFLGNKYIDSQNNTLQQNIDRLEQNIANIEWDTNVQVYALYESNKSIIETLDYRSKVSFFINQIDQIALKYWLVINGFNYSDGTIETQTYVRSDEFWLAYKKLKAFIDEYRKDEKRVFDLEFVDSVIGGDNMKLNMKFTIN